MVAPCLCPSLSVCMSCACVGNRKYTQLRSLYCCQRVGVTHKSRKQDKSEAGWGQPMVKMSDNNYDRNNTPTQLITVFRNISIDHRNTAKSWFPSRTEKCGYEQHLVFILGCSFVYVCVCLCVCIHAHQQACVCVPVNICASVQVCLCMKKVDRSHRVDSKRRKVLVSICL